MTRATALYLCAIVTIAAALVAWCGWELAAIRFEARGISVELFNLPRELRQR